MRAIAYKLRTAVDQLRDDVGIEGAALIAGTALVAYAASLFDPRLFWAVIGLVLLLVAYATARPTAPRPPRA